MGIVALHLTSWIGLIADCARRSNSLRIRSPLNSMKLRPGLNERHANSYLSSRFKPRYVALKQVWVSGFHRFSLVGVAALLSTFAI